MQVHFLLFALYRDLAGAEAFTLEVPAGATAADAVLQLRGRGPGFARIPEQPVVAINREYAPLHTPLRDQDELALLPPVAGG
jgi:molybdopterin synthase catalytic subunit